MVCYKLFLFFFNNLKNLFKFFWVYLCLLVILFIELCGDYSQYLEISGFIILIYIYLYVNIGYVYKICIK